MTFAQRTRHSRRWIVPLVLGVSLYIAFIDRMNLSIAMPHIAEHYGWSASEIGNKGGLLLGSFFVAYGISNILLSGFAARIGARRSLIALVICFSIFTALGAPLGNSLALFVMTRILLGFGEGVHFPMMSVVTQNWFPVFERSRANGIWGFGSILAMVTMPIFLVPIIEKYGWQAMLLVCGALGILVTVPLLYFFIFDTPRNAPYMSREEVNYIAHGIIGDAAPVPADWSFLKSRVFILAAIGAVLNNFCCYGIINWLPTYFVKARSMDFSNLWYAASLPYIAAFVAFVLFGLLGDKLNRRIPFAAAGFLATTVCLLYAIKAPTIPLAVAAFSTATFFQSAYISQEFAIVQRILPAEILGKAAGVYTGISVLGGAVGGTILLGQIVAFTGSYDAGLYSVVVASVLGAVVMGLLSRSVKY